MKKIGLLSDTHSYLDQAIFKHFDSCDEIWHAGDFGNIELLDTLAAFKPLRGVYGNIDGKEIRYSRLIRLNRNVVTLLQLFSGTNEHSTQTSMHSLGYLRKFSMRYGHFWSMTRV